LAAPSPPEANDTAKAPGLAFEAREGRKIAAENNLKISLAMY